MDHGTSETRLGASSSHPAHAAGFAPGTLLADRYRIVAMVGKGGMGEVYRADDLRLGQPVALKCLPAALEHDADARDRLLAEVRSARTVSHPNVCRVYDIADVDGRYFLTMEYIDGEDLASLLRRIGRLPPGKALEIARQLCAGLAAAHERGVLHRDLKPANVMIDGRGQARITDFGLALRLAEELEPARSGQAGATAAVAHVAGTIAYLAPERFEGKPATVQSDLYALGLVLYEIYTGRQALSATTLEGWRRAHSDSTPSHPSAIVSEIEPAVERAILRCLEKDPAKRPASAAQLAAALPGGDPLAAAIAAGETPSPELVAASGEEGTLPRRAAWLWLAAVVVALAVVAVSWTAVSFPAWMPFDEPPGNLQKQARDILAELGSGPRAVSAWSIRRDTEFLEHATRANPPVSFDDFANAVPGMLRFAYRQSSAPFAVPPSGALLLPLDPAPRPDGDAYVELDLGGRLTGLSIVRPASDEAAGPRTTTDWAPLFRAAGLDPGQFVDAEPRVWPDQASDERRAWEGQYEQQRFRVDAAALRGHPVFFRLAAAWSAPSASPWRQERAAAEQAYELVGELASLAALVVVAALARRNLRLGRGDRTGAFRVAAFVGALDAVFVFVARWPILAPSTLVAAILTIVGTSFGSAFAAWLAYVGIEPYVRRRWPHMLVAWTRLLDGRWRDPLVGRSILVGLVVGCAYAFPYSVLLPRVLGLSGAAPVYPDGALESLGMFVAGVFRDLLIAGVALTFVSIAVAVLARLVLRRTAPAFVALGLLWSTLVALSLVAVRPSALSIVVVVIVCAIVTGLLMWTLWKSGALAFGIAVGTTYFLQDVPWTFDFSRWYAWRCWFAVAVVLALAYWGFRNVLGRQAAFPADALDA